GACASCCRHPTRAWAIIGCPHPKTTVCIWFYGFTNRRPSIWRGASATRRCGASPAQCTRLRRQLHCQHANSYRRTDTMKVPLEGKVAIVTGAGSGIGRSHALALAELGATVVVNDIGSQAVSVAQEITSAGGRSLPVQGDVTCFDDMQDMVSGVIDMFERVDILVNNAGILRDRSFAKMSLEDFRQVIDVHLMGSVHATKAVWPHMQAQNSGRIVMTTSSS